MLTISDELKTYKKRQINEWIHRFCYMCRNPQEQVGGPWILLPELEFVPMNRVVHPVMGKFYNYMVSRPLSVHQLSRLHCSITCLCPCVTKQEWQYAAYIMDTYYGK